MCNKILLILIIQLLSRDLVVNRKLGYMIFDTADICNTLFSPILSCQVLQSNIVHISLVCCVVWLCHRDIHYIEYSFQIQSSIHYSRGCVILLFHFIQFHYWSINICPDNVLTPFVIISINI